MRNLPTLLLAATLACACSPSPSAPAAPATTPGTLKCKTGPAVRAFGGYEWLVYACDDRRSVVLMTKDDNPAHPYYFMLVPGTAGPRLIGEGWDRAQATNDAYAELSAKLNAAFVADLHAVATAAAAAPAPAPAREDEAIPIQ